MTTSSPPSLNLGKAANILLTAGVIGIGACLLIWFATMPGGPGAAMERQGSGTLMSVYAQCLYSSAFYVSWLSCPLGGNLYLLLWVSVAVLLVGLLVKASTSKAA